MATQIILRERWTANWNEYISTWSFILKYSELVQRRIPFKAFFPERERRRCGDMNGSLGVQPRIIRSGQISVEMFLDKISFGQIFISINCGERRFVYTVLWSVLFGPLTTRKRYLVTRRMKWEPIGSYCSRTLGAWSRVDSTMDSEHSPWRRIMTNGHRSGTVTRTVTGTVTGLLPWTVSAAGLADQNCALCFTI